MIWNVSILFWINRILWCLVLCCSSDMNLGFVRRSLVWLGIVLNMIVASCGLNVLSVVSRVLLLLIGILKLLCLLMLGVVEVMIVL